MILIIEYVVLKKSVPCTHGGSKIFKGVLLRGQDLYLHRRDLVTRGKSWHGALRENLTFRKHKKIDNETERNAVGPAPP